MGITCFFPGSSHAHIVVHFCSGEIVFHAFLQIFFSFIYKGGKYTIKSIKTISKLLSSNRNPSSIVFQVHRSFFCRLMFRDFFRKRISFPDAELIESQLLAFRNTGKDSFGKIGKLQMNHSRFFRYLIRNLINLCRPCRMRLRRYRSLFGHFSVQADLIANFQRFFHRQYIQPACKLHKSLFAIHQFCPHRADHIFVFQKARRHPAIGINQTIHTEIAVMLLFSKISAVQEPFFSVGGNAVIDCMITPFPYAAAENPGIFQKNLHILFQISRAISHGMTKLTQHIGASVILFQIFPDSLKIVVHPAVHIQHGCIIRKLFILINAFVVHQSVRIVFFDPPSGRFHKWTCPRLISQRPHNNTGAVFIDNDIPFISVQNRFRKHFHFHCNGHSLHVIQFLIFPQKLHASMGFQITFANHIKSIPVTKLCKPGSIGIMACANCIHIMLFHQKKVFFCLFSADGISCFGIAVMAVDAFDFYRYPIHIYHCIFDADMAETGFFPDDLIACADLHLIKIWNLRAPE